MHILTACLSIFRPPSIMATLRCLKTVLALYVRRLMNELVRGTTRTFWPKCSKRKMLACTTSSARRGDPCMARFDGRKLLRKGRLVPLVVKNNHFGGNVDVTGLLCGGFDVAMAIRGISAHDYVVLPKNHVQLNGCKLMI